jgi:hypothetical protein
MKKIFITLVAIAALAACTKSEVAYEASAEIGFAPAVKNITKAANVSGALDSSNELGIWAFWNGIGGEIEDEGATYDEYTDTYLSNALFVNRSSSANWGGDTPYPWPTNGALVFAGYNKPEGATFTATYSGLDDDTMTFTNYTQSTDLAETFDLCWFGKTANSYNYRTSASTAVPVTMSHALTWITIKVRGDANTAPTAEGSKPWKVTKATLLKVNTIGTEGTCIFDAEDENKAKATWESSDPDNIVVNETAAIKDANNVIIDGGTPLTPEGVVYESTANGLVVIPQTPVFLEIEYIYPVSGVYKEGKTTVNLTLDGTKKEDGTTVNTTIDKWLSGTHYTYTIVFKANEILVAPSYGEWATSNQSVTVE